jgi:serine/threonine protein kinase
MTTPSSGRTESDSTPLPHGFHGELPNVAVGTLGQRVKLSLPWADLSDDDFILKAPRIEVEGRRVPALGGIPLFCRLGQGGMGAVYYGVHPGFAREVAVKVLPFHLANTNSESIFRFFREARIASKVNSMNLVRVTDVAKEGPLTYLVMDYVNGKSAAALLQAICRGGAWGMDEDQALDICIAACRGLMAAHDERVIHRDIKPDNILIPRKKDTHQFDFDRAKLSDLGIARCDELHATLTAPHMCLGTPGFMPPEQIDDSRNVGKQADVFAMGATLYQLLTGCLPFVGASPMEVMKATARTPHIYVRTHRKDISKPTAEAIDICLAKAASHRYSDGAALLKALLACRALLDDPQGGDFAAVNQPRLEREAANQPRLVIDDDGKIVNPTTKTKNIPAPTRFIRKRWWAALIGAVGLGSYLWYGSMPNSTRDRAAPPINALDQEELDFDRSMAQKARSQASTQDAYAKKLKELEAAEATALARKISNGDAPNPDVEAFVTQVQGLIANEQWDRAFASLTDFAAKAQSVQGVNKNALGALQTLVAAHLKRKPL